VVANCGTDAVGRERRWAAVREVASQGQAIITPPALLRHGTQTAYNAQSAVMSRVLLHIVATVAVAVLAIGCGGTQKPQLKVLGIEQSVRSGATGQGQTVKLFVEVTNYAKRPMRLQRLQYVFGPSSSTGAGLARGEVTLSRTVEAGSAIVLEVPILVDPDLLAHGDLELRGNLITEQDQILRAYPVSAEVGERHSDEPERVSTEPPPQP